MLNKYGDFSQCGKEFIISTPDIERNWYNYMYNDNYMSFTSQVGTGEGFLQDRLGSRIIPVCGRGVYALCDGKGWNLSGLPVYDAERKYRCIHGLGYTKIEVEKYGVFTEYGIFVPCEESKIDGYEVIWVKVRNNTSDKKIIKLMAYSSDFAPQYLSLSLYGLSFTRSY